ncbi:hypothetical protein D9757_005951 [Collybiopsis confluens]|uniref:Glutaminase A N-terminal domain-containing protein n=1 Tax=Collybiopsis confluens TaxID=2823264 RepID=A0A8H5HUP2_9AGAR|nr:hypothetical protein D9757_005951 [Collybiopsis confluens]
MIILGWTGLVWVDNALYTWLGQPGSLMLNNGTKLNNAAFNGYQVTPTRSILRLTAGNMNINVTFLSPIEPSDLVLQSFPFSYIYFEASSHDENSHSVRVYQDITGEWLSNDVTNIMQWNTTAVQNTTTLYHEAQQLPFQFIEENDMAKDGVVYHVTNTGSGVTYQSGEDTILRSGFLNNGALPNTQETMNRAISEQGIGLVRSPDIMYATTTGNQTRRPYFFKYESGGVPTAIVDFMSDA